MMATRTIVHDIVIGRVQKALEAEKRLKDFWMSELVNGLSEEEVEFVHNILRLDAEAWRKLVEKTVREKME